MRFSRIRLENWRNFASVDVPVENRTFLVGQNASGKSNFLDALRFLRDIVSPGGGFQSAVNRRGGVSLLRNINARHPYMDIAVDVELSTDGDMNWRYQLVFSQDNLRRPTLKEEKVWQKDRLLVNRPDAEDKQDEARLRQTMLEQTFANYAFRDIANFFESVTYWHIVPHLVRDTERYIGSQGDPFGGDFLEQIAQAHKRSRDARLRRIQEALRLAIPQLSELEWYRDDKGLPHLRGRYDNWRPRGVWQEEREFSDGTLRLIGLFWALQDGTGPLLLEEPELSLHPGVVRRLPEIMYTIQREQKQSFRQIFLSTHSPELLSEGSIAPDEILLFQAEPEGTIIKPGSEISHIKAELDAGFTMAEIVLPETDPTR